MGLRPNTISLLSVVFAAIAGACLAGSARVEVPWRAGCLIVAAVCIQFRLLCNLFDGMVAVECGFQSKTGEIWNDLPDRLADLVILVGAGYSITSHARADVLGWVAGALALITAYVRVLGRTAGAPQTFVGPMAKPHRMATITVACVVAAFEPLWSGSGGVMLAALALVIVGCVVTVVRRLRIVVAALESR